jgi:hypothetical protein
MKYLPVALALAALATAGTAPAFAQSFTPEVGSGNIVAFNDAQTAQNRQIAVRQNSRIAVRQDGLHAYAMVPVYPTVWPSSQALGANR